MITRKVDERPSCGISTAEQATAENVDESQEYEHSGWECTAPIICITDKICITSTAVTIASSNTANYSKVNLEKTYLT